VRDNEEIAAAIDGVRDNEEIAAAIEEGTRRALNEDARRQDLFFREIDTF
jgi:hypothetical protein